MSEEDIIKAGITAVKSGDLTRAASLFARVVKENPSSERGWFLLGMSCSTLEQREYCLRRVLAINPNHSESRKQLAGIGTACAHCVASCLGFARAKTLQPSETTCFKVRPACKPSGVSSLPPLLLYMKMTQDTAEEVMSRQSLPMKSLF